MNKVYPDKIKEQALKYHKRGWTFAAIAKKLKVSNSIAYYWVKQERQR